MRVGGGPERVAPSILRERVAEWFETDDDGLLPAHEDGCAGDGGSGWWRDPSQLNDNLFAI